MKTAVWALVVGLFPDNASATLPPEREQAAVLMRLRAIKHRPPVAQDNQSVCRSTLRDCDSESSQCRALPNGSIRHCAPAPMELFITSKQAVRKPEAAAALEVAAREMN